MLNIADPYVCFLRSCRHRLFHCWPYPGNSGDELIQKGTLQLLLDLGIDVTSDPGKAEIILYPGGCPTMHSQVMASIRETLKTFPEAELVIGPATFQFGHTDWVDVCNRFSSRIAALFARDPDSFTNLQRASLRNNIKTGLSHDSALYLRNSEWLEGHKQNAKEEYVLAAFRRGHEMETGIVGRWIKHLQLYLPPKTFKKLTHWGRKRARLRRSKLARKISDQELVFKEVNIANLDFNSYVDAIRCSRDVHTDRLHVMLLAVMLGKPVFAYETSYQKLESVYEHSLKEWANVTFISSKYRNNKKQAKTALKSKLL